MKTSDLQASQELLSSEMVREARLRTKDYISPSPIKQSRALAHVGNVHLKLECCHPTGSFKIRGALNILKTLPREVLSQGIVVASSGNHAIALCWARQVLGQDFPCKIFVPRTIPGAKLQRLANYHVDCQMVGVSYDDAALAAQAFARDEELTFVGAYEDDRVIAGNGVVGLELLEQSPTPTLVVVPVGAGSLLAGLALAMKATVPGVRIIGVQPSTSATFRDSIAVGRYLTHYAVGHTIADGLVGGISNTLWRNRHLVDHVLSVSDDEIEHAIFKLATEDHVIAEPSGAAGVAAILSEKLDIKQEMVVAVITGRNIDPELLTRLIQTRLSGESSSSVPL